jgi:hypothetical protein
VVRAGRCHRGVAGQRHLDLDLAVESLQGSGDGLGDRGLDEVMQRLDFHRRDG